MTDIFYNRMYNMRKIEKCYRFFSLQNGSKTFFFFFLEYRHNCTFCANCNRLSSICGRTLCRPSRWRRLPSPVDHWGIRWKCDQLSKKNVLRGHSPVATSELFCHMNPRLSLRHSLKVRPTQHKKNVLRKHSPIVAI